MTADKIREPQSPTTSPGRLLTFGQAAARLGVGVSDVRRMARTERCPTVRVGRRVRIPAAWIDELLTKENGLAPSDARPGTQSLPDTANPC